MKTMAEKLEVDPKVIKNSLPTTRSTRSARKSAFKGNLAQIDSTLKSEVVEASRSFMQEFPSMLLKALTKKAKEEGFVAKWTAYIEAKLNDDNRAAFARFDQPAKEAFYREMANTLRPGTKKVTRETVTDESEDEEEVLVQRKRRRHTRRYVEEGGAEDEERSDNFDGSTFVEEDPAE
jgi:hypothetical protein